VLRWNSWDMLLHPRLVLADLAAPLADPSRHRTAIGITLIFTALMLAFYLPFVSALSSRSGDGRRS
jgi:uncharacterized membrane protein